MSCKCLCEKIRTQPRAKLNSSLSKMVLWCPGMSWYWAICLVYESPIFLKSKNIDVNHECLLVSFGLSTSRSVGYKLSITVMEPLQYFGSLLLTNTDLCVTYRIWQRRNMVSCSLKHHLEPKWSQSRFSHHYQSDKPLCMSTFMSNKYLMRYGESIISRWKMAKVRPSVAQFKNISYSIL